MQARFWEIDALRGLAVVLMVVFNYAFALRFFDIYTVDAGALFWFWFPRFIGAMFIFIAGMSFALSYSRIRKKDTRSVYRKYLLRGGKIFGLGLLITAATWIVVPTVAIFFGILHLIGLSVILAVFFRNAKANAVAVAGLVLILTGIYLQTFTVPYSYLLWIGVVPAGFYTLDYFPLLPWFGFMLLGVSVGNRLYANGRRVFKIRESAGALSAVSLLGRRSLLVYVAHVPVLLAVLYALGYGLF